MKTLQLLSFFLLLSFGLSTTANAQTKSKVIIIEEYVDEDGNVQTKKTVTESDDMEELEDLFDSEMMHIDIDELLEDGERSIIIDTDGDANVFRFDMHGDHPFLGVHLEDYAKGLTISSVVEESAAEKAGLQEGDIIKTFNGTEVRGSSDFIAMIGDKAVGEEVQVGIERDGKEMLVNATLGKKAHSGFMMKKKQCTPGNSFNWNNQDNQMFQGTSPRMHREFFMNPNAHRLGVTVHEGDEGLEVKSVKPGSVADENGIKTGDIITHHNGDKIESLDDFASEISEKKAGSAYELKLQRDGKKEKITITVATPAEKKKLRRL